MKHKKEWNEEEVIEFLEDSIKDLKRIKGDFQGLLNRAEIQNNAEKVAYVKEVIIEINIQIKGFESELKKKLIKKPS